jgi:GNAT superfamily N-acetyltransferase
VAVKIDHGMPQALANLCCFGHCAIKALRPCKVKCDTMRPVNVRRAASAEDVCEATAVWLRARDAAVPAIPPRTHDDDDVRRWFAAVNATERELYVAQAAGGSIVGVMVLHDDWLDQLYVDVGWTGRGIGSECLTLGKRLRPDGLQLWAFQSNAGARRFYERHGFRAIQFMDGDNEERQPDVRYVWP